MRVESSSFPRELVSFVHAKELVSFDQWQVTLSPPFEYEGITVLLTLLQNFLSTQ